MLTVRATCPMCDWQSEVDAPVDEQNKEVVEFATRNMNNFLYKSVGEHVITEHCKK